MSIGRTFGRLLLAALLSGAAAGMLVLLLIGIGILLMDPRIGQIRSGFGEAAMLLTYAALLGAMLASLPALLLGALLWTVGSSFAEARHWAAWAATGALAGAGFFSLLGRLPGSTFIDFLPVFLLAGAGAALLFRWVMRATQPLLSYSVPI